MIELPLILLGGVLGSAHCVGMCGGFAVLIGAGARGWVPALGRQLLYSAGRLFTYGSLGGAAGYLGARFIARWTDLIDLQSLLSAVAGLLLIVQGLAARGLWFRRRGTRPAQGCAAVNIFRSFLVLPGAWNYFAAGLLTGFLPCGLVYAYLALAASSGDLMHGLAIMVAFGAGTVPLMALTGAGGSLISVANRLRLLRLAAWCVVLTGALTLMRGALSYARSGDGPGKSCPFCETTASFKSEAAGSSGTQGRPARPTG